MSQHDFNIANQSMPAARSDINNALLALVSQSSGATAPATTYAYQWWFDTSTNILCVRNAANTTWVQFLHINPTTNAYSLVGMGNAGYFTAQTDIADQTLGRLMQTGGFGLGLNGAGLWSANLNNPAHPAGFWRYSSVTANLPAGANTTGSFLVIRGADATSYTIILTDYFGTVYVRACKTGTYGSWVKVMTDDMIATLAEAYSATDDTKIMTPTKVGSKLAAYAMPKATASGGPGNYTYIGAATNNALTLPSGGTWIYFYVAINSGAVHTIATGIVAGGTTVWNASSVVYAIGFAWRIS